MTEAAGAPVTQDAALRRGRWAARALMALAAAALVINVVWIARHLDWLRPLEPGAPAPSFDLPVLAAGGPRGAAVGARVRDVDLRGQIVVLEFWATWCKPCLQSLPRMDAAARRWGERVTVLAVNVDDGEKAASMFGEAGWRGLTLVGDDGEAASRYQVDVLPHVVVIDRAGVVRLVGQGGGGGRDAEGAVARLLGD